LVSGKMGLCHVEIDQGSSIITLLLPKVSWDPYYYLGQKSSLI
jgi:hypothetical protein